MYSPGITFKPPSQWWQGLATLPESEAAPAADATAWSLVGLLLFCTVCFLGGALALRKREHSASAEPGTEAPPSHVQRPEASQKAENTDEGPKRQPWERGADWWKDQE